MVGVKQGSASSRAPILETQPARLLRWREVANLTGLGRSTAERMAASGHFPSPRRMPGTTRVAWVEAEVRAWVEARVACVD